MAGRDVEILVLPWSCAVRPSKFIGSVDDGTMVAAWHERS